MLPGACHVHRPEKEYLGQDSALQRAPLFPSPRVRAALRAFKGILLAPSMGEFK